MSYTVFFQKKRSSFLLQGKEYSSLASIPYQSITAGRNEPISGESVFSQNLFCIGIFFLQVPLRANHETELNVSFSQRKIPLVSQLDAKKKKLPVRQLQNSKTVVRSHVLEQNGSLWPEEKVLVRNNVPYTGTSSC